MSNDDLLRMLNLEGKEAPQMNETLPITHADEVKKVTPASPTALRLDDWGLRRGADVLRESERLQQCLAALGDEERQAHAVADFHGAAFEVDPQLNEGCADPLRRDFIKQLLETPECHELRASTVLNDTASEIATTAFAGQYAELRKERDQDEKKEPGKEGGPGHDLRSTKRPSPASGRTPDTARWSVPPNASARRGSRLKPTPTTSPRRRSGWRSSWPRPRARSAPRSRRWPTAASPSPAPPDPSSRPWIPPVSPVGSQVEPAGLLPFPKPERSIMALTTLPPARSPLRDLHFLGDPDLWTLWPFLPVVRRHPDGRTDYGVLFDAQAVCNLTGYRCTVWLTNLFTLPRHLD
jgi:hypothetical protein